ncbi:MAG: ABC transporter ATP-binding protein [bacterium]|nr:ABC transporter ATP-binding protein [bacterium]
MTDTEEPQTLDTNPAIEVRGLTQAYGLHPAVEDISFQVKKGEIFCLFGGAGAGKTTVLRMAAGLLSPKSGTVLIHNRDIWRHGTDPDTAIGVVLEAANPYLAMTGLENVTTFGELNGSDIGNLKERTERIMKQFGLWNRRHEYALDYPDALRQLLMIAMALINEPGVLFLDDPTASLDFLSRQLIHTAVRQQAEKNAAVLLTTSNLDEARGLGHRMASIIAGRLTIVEDLK